MQGNNIRYGLAIHSKLLQSKVYYQYTIVFFLLSTIRFHIAGLSKENNISVSSSTDTDLLFVRKSFDGRSSFFKVYYAGIGDLYCI